MAEAGPLSWDKSQHRTRLPLRWSTNHEEAFKDDTAQVRGGTELEAAELLGQTVVAFIIIMFNNKGNTLTDPELRSPVVQD